MKKTRKELEAELQIATEKTEPSADQTMVETHGEPTGAATCEGSEESVAADVSGLTLAVESLLFVASAPLSLSDLLGVLREFHPRLETEELRDVLKLLGERLEKEKRGVRLCEVAGGYQLRTPPEAAPYLRRLETSRPPRMSRATLETLAIVAYRQPVTRGEIENIRGVDCGAVLRGLLEKKMIRILGRKDEPGRPLIYGTTKEFLAFFSLKDLASLPTLRDFAELSDEARQKLGPGYAPSEATRAEEPQLPEPLAEQQQAAYSPPGDDEMVQELNQVLEEIRHRDARLREVLPPAPAAASAEAPPTVEGQGGSGSQEQGA